LIPQGCFSADIVSTVLGPLPPDGRSTSWNWATTSLTSVRELEALVSLDLTFLTKEPKECGSDESKNAGKVTAHAQISPTLSSRMLQWD
jgi:hypothetical protein